MGVHSNGNPEGESVIQIPQVLYDGHTLKITLEFNPPPPEDSVSEIAHTANSFATALLAVLQYFRLASSNPYKQLGRLEDDISTRTIGTEVEIEQLTQ